MKKENQLSEMENIFLALSDKTRLRILNLMRGGEVCVNYFTEILRESQPKISRHLAYLRNAKIVAAKRDGKWMHYRIIFPENKFASSVLQNTLEWLENQAEMREEYKKLSERFYSEIIQFDNDELELSNISSKADMNVNTKDELEVFLL